MEKQLNYYISQLEFHRYNPDWFLFKEVKDLNFDILLYEDLLTLIDDIKSIYKWKKNISRSIVSIIFEINSLYQSKIEDVASNKCTYNITLNELWDRWEVLKFKILDFFDDVSRG